MGVCGDAAESAFKLPAGGINNRKLYFYRACLEVHLQKLVLLKTDASTFKAEVDWMPRDIPIPFLVYYSGSENSSHRHPNVGFEAMGYLTFIAEYYDCLPKVTVFAHPHKSSYHTYQDLNRALQSVFWKNIPGYATLHPLGAAWADFHPWDANLNLKGKSVSTEGLTEPPDCFYVINGTLYEYWPRWEAQRAEWIALAWDRFFGPVGLGPMPERIRLATTAEFFVTRERIHLQSKDFYLQARQWILEAEQEEIFSSWQLAVVFELLWHYILGEPAYMSSPPLQPCELYHCKNKSIDVQ